VIVGKEELIISTAIKILAGQNYQTMTTAALASAAGIAEGTIYCYFKSKKELFIRVLQHISDKLSELFVRGIGEHQSLRENLEILGANFFHMDEETSILYKILYKAFSEVEDEDIKKELGIVYIKGLANIRKMIEWKRNDNTVIPDSRTEMILMLLWGIGDMLWKRLTINNYDSTLTAELGPVIDFICKWIDQ
jgi:TetR/AcrR family transcriptional regulator, fatty acid metabolism regulator protein